MDFATKLRAMRAIRDISQKQLAEMTGIPNTYISDMESGKTLPNSEWEARLKAALQWPTDDAPFAILAGTNGHTQPAQQPATS